MKFKARGQVAQLVERSPEKAGVGGSIPSLATTLNFPIFIDLWVYHTSIRLLKVVAVESTWSPNGVHFSREAFLRLWDDGRHTLQIQAP